MLLQGLISRSIVLNSDGLQLAQSQPLLKPYWEVQGEITIHDNLLLCQKHIAVPASFQ